MCTFYKNLVVLHHGDIILYTIHLYQIQTFNNNLNDKEITTHLICTVKQLFYDANITVKREKKTFRHGKI